ncbi:MAG: methylated-DNA--[protein]-cysteine S-methyltransferase [Candidatus Protochlamydia sp.]|nr:methylated-DNA--[protein]-cysteine S-methyltransferase [Candidatus Protochlamydia sp.]
MNLLKYKIIQSPVGSLKIIVSEKCLLAILWDNEKFNRVRLDQLTEDEDDSIILETEKQLNEYFFSQRRGFDLPIETLGTSFQQGVWKQLNQIPYGTTWSYKDIALKINNPLAVRAVGSAIGRNPISIIVPCHRVVGSNGSLTGFAGGLDRKKFLLDIERN